MIILGWILLFIILSIGLSFNRASLLVSTIGFFVYLLLVTILSHASWITLTVLWILFVVFSVISNIGVLRRILITKYLLSVYRKLLPKMSKTEREALTAGSVGFAAEIFTGMPDWQKLRDFPENKLTAEEKAFLDGPVEELCGMIKNWEINHIYYDIPEEIWTHLKKHKYFGFIIPKKYGGNLMSATAQGHIFAKVNGVSVAIGIVVSVPNSLGPAELILEYGTEEQKDYYLPRLASGDEIPCFALTSPVAGSDASSIIDNGIVCKREFKGKETLGILLNWDKRYITLSPVATLLGLAFKLYDPDHLIGDQEDVGITCALIPTDLPGVTVGRRHYPLTSAFPNGPTQGKDVFIPIEWIVGGKKMAGQGWRMLMECLAAGRAISLPSAACGGAKAAMFASGAYARVRRQFGTYIGSFGGIQEALAEIGGFTYIMEATRLFTLATVDSGIKPVVASAISKYHTTEMGRQVAMRAMEIHGGKGICMGPNNYLAQGQIEAPISITVEGANILTRSMIIFGQGAIRCHPFILKEITAAEENDHVQGLKDFDRAAFSHLGMFVSNAVRSFWLGMTNGRMAWAPSGSLKRYYQQFSRYAAAFSFVADFAVLTLTNQLKRNEHLSGRLADLLSYLYMASAVMKFYELEDNIEEWPLVCWACDFLLFKLRRQLDEFICNFPNRIYAKILRRIVFPIGFTAKPPKDTVSKSVARILLNPSSVRERFAQYVYKANTPNNPLGKLDDVLHRVIQVEQFEKKIHKAEKQGIIKGRNFEEKVAEAVDHNILTKEEAAELSSVNVDRMSVINVDDFDHKELQRKSYPKTSSKSSSKFRSARNQPDADDKQE